MTDIEGAIRFFNGWKNRDEKDRKILPQNTVAYNAYTKEIEYLELAIKALKQEPKWIPVSDRLPEDNELVLFSTKTDRVFEGRFFSDNTNRQWYSFCDRTFAWNNVVIAWMPLPEPYKAESEVE